MAVSSNKKTEGGKIESNPDGINSPESEGAPEPQRNEILVGFPGNQGQNDFPADVDSQPQEIDSDMATETGDDQTNFEEKRRFVRVPKEMDFVLRRGATRLTA